MKKITNDDFKEIDVSKIHLNPDNPRHRRINDQKEVIKHLCKEEKISFLAEDIAVSGLNPGDNFIVFPSNNSGHYICAEGNRRLCAIKLLNDPDLVPENLKKRFSKLPKTDTIRTIRAAIIQDQDRIKFWLNRIHGGEDGGRGRRQWGAEEKARNTGYNKNVHAIYLMDFADRVGLITPAERKGRLSTVQRYVTAGPFQLIWELSFEETGIIKTTRSRNDIAIYLNKFIRDVAGKKINTRAKSKDIAKYLKEYNKLDSIDNETVEAWEIHTLKLQLSKKNKTKELGRSNANGLSKKTSKAASLINLYYDENLEKSLSALNNYKLMHLYNSLCKIHIKDNECMLTVGVWCFLETLTSICGRNENTPFISFLSKSKINSLVIKNNSKSINEALGRISRNGNTTKHDGTSGSFNGPQLYNDFETITPLISKLVEDAIINRVS
ncbi:MAG: hypothetical protein V6Z81_06065 [Parvularculales bacterium]